MKNLTQYVRKIGRLPEILTAARSFEPAIPLTLAYLEAGSLAYPVDVRLHGRLRVRLMEPEDLKILWHIFVRKCYEIAGDERVILDLGGNVGFFALYAAMNAPHARIFSAEPLPATFNRLVEHVEWNRFSNRVTALNYAITGEAGQRYIGGEDVPTGQKRLVTRHQDVTASDIPIQSRTLTSVLEEYNIDRIDMAKVDIEGSEFEVLLATAPAVLNRIARLDLEVHNNITAKGYTLDGLIRHLHTGGLDVTSLETDEEGFSQVRLVRKPAPR